MMVQSHLLEVNILHQKICHQRCIELTNVALFPRKKLDVKELRWPYHQPDPKISPAPLGMTCKLYLSLVVRLATP